MSSRPFNWRVFQQNRPEADMQQAPVNVCLLGDFVEKVESLTSLQICQNTNDIFD